MRTSLLWMSSRVQHPQSLLRLPSLPWGKSPCLCSSLLCSCCISRGPAKWSRLLLIIRRMRACGWWTWIQGHLHCLSLGCPWIFKKSRSRGLYTNLSALPHPSLHYWSKHNGCNRPPSQQLLRDWTSDQSPNTTPLMPTGSQFTVWSSIVPHHHRSPFPTYVAILFPPLDSRVYSTTIIYSVKYVLLPKIVKFSHRFTQLCDLFTFTIT